MENVNITDLAANMEKTAGLARVISGEGSRLRELTATLGMLARIVEHSGYIGSTDLNPDDRRELNAETEMIYERLLEIDQHISVIQSSTGWQKEIIKKAFDRPKGTVQ